MDDAEKHYPPGSEAEEQAAAEAAKSEAEAKAKAEAEAADKAKAEAEAAEKAKADEAAKAEAEAKAKAEEEAKGKTDIKKRSIYDDLKDERRDRKQAQTDLEAEKAAREAAETKAAELQALLEKKDEAKTDKDKAEVDDEIKQFAEKQQLNPEALAELTSIILKRVPKAEMPEGLKPEEIEQWRKDQEARKVEVEDRAIDAQSTEIRQQAKDLGFEVHNDGEFAKVMTEIKRLSHTQRYHDKEIAYIVWAEREALSKMVSPKKPSFESGDDNRAEGKEENMDFSKGGVTPEQAGKATQKGPRPGYDFRRVS